MAIDKSRSYFFYGLFLIAIFLVAMVFWPFVNSIVAALVVAVLFKPVFVKILKAVGDRRAIASALTILLISIVLILPISLLSLQIVSQARTVTVSLLDNDTTATLERVTGEIESLVQKVLPGFQIEAADIQDQLSSYALSGALDNWTLIKSGTLSLLHAILIFIISAISLYFVLKDGHKLKDEVVRYSPLKDEDDLRILNKLEKTINSIIRGALVVALIQGVLAGIGYLIFGLPNATLWGVVTGVAALVPGIGTALILIPSAIYLMVTGETIIMGLLLLVWGAVIVGLADNILAPYFYSRGVEIHPVLILISVLGGLAMFGPLGFLYGPLSLSLLFTLLKMYKPITDRAE